jgi:hypothetical protein
MTDHIGYQGPPPTAEDVSAAVLADEELMRQVGSGLEKERQGIPPVPWRQVRVEAMRRDEEARRRTA